MQTIKLNQANLHTISGKVAVPLYSRKDLVPRICHIGLGHFHRSHQAAYLDELLSRGLCNSGIAEINLAPDPYPVDRIAGAQDYLYTLVSKSARGEESARVIGSLLSYINIQDVTGTIDGWITRQCDLITVTVTEKGYHYDAASGDISWDHGPIQQDLAHPLKAGAPFKPQTLAGFLSAYLSLRYKTRAPLTIMSCDNIPNNGKVLRKCVLAFCRALYPETVSWVEESVAFPSTMVDRITPGTTREAIEHVGEVYGIDDQWTVCCEDFRQWVVEDNFLTPVSGRGGIFPLENLADTGVQLTGDVEPYELMKIRLLNGSHSALSYPSYLLGHRDVAEAVLDPLIGEFVRRRYMEEITVTLSPVPGIDLSSYKDTLISRFSNRNIADTVLRLAQDGSRKIPNSILTPLAEAVNQGQKHEAVVFALAAWARFLEGRDEGGVPIPLDDANGAAVAAAAGTAQENPEQFLKVIGLNGISGEAFTKLTGMFAAYLKEIHAQGIRGALQRFIG
ncbi:MAG: mannitol dehydrogenase family protein [Treponema sp.]|jgi:mannitol-1-phosphate/altronate dehydrogenase|nr:mannitol dehydrogenase family protein [Treponema sp.]